MPHSLPDHDASRVSSRSSVHTVTGSQTPDLGTVRESAGSRGSFLHGRSTSRAAHPLQPVGVVLSTGRATQLSSCAASFDAAEHRMADQQGWLRDSQIMLHSPQPFQVLLHSPCQLAHSAVIYTLP